MNKISEARWRLTERRLQTLRWAVKRLKNQNAKLEHSLSSLAYMFDADADGGFMFRWHNETQMRREVRHANRLLGRDDTKIGRRL